MKRPAALPALPEKHFFKIGEVAELVGVRTSVLRFWESEFPQIRPTKTQNGHRVYARADVELLRRIHVLVHAKGYTLAGARALLQQGEAAVSAVLEAAPREVASELSAAEARLGEVGAENATLRGRIAALEKSLREARDEAFFWRRRALSEEKRTREVAERLRPLLQGLREAAKEPLPRETD